MPATGTCEYDINAHDEVTAVEGDWERMASDNEAEGLVDRPRVKRLIWDFISNPDVAQVYRMLFARVRRDGAPVSFTYRCDHASARRLYGMRLTGLDGAGVRLSTWLIEETARESVRLLERDVPRSSELVYVCSWCNRVRMGDRWLEVEDALHETSLFEAERVPAITHGVCRPCAAEWFPASLLSEPR
jgi:hypothetical protein